MEWLGSLGASLKRRVFHYVLGSTIGPLLQAPLPLSSIHIDPTTGAGRASGLAFHPAALQAAFSRAQLRVVAAHIRSATVGIDLSVHISGVDIEVARSIGDSGAPASDASPPNHETPPPPSGVAGMLQSVIDAALRQLQVKRAAVSQRRWC